MPMKRWLAGVLLGTLVLWGGRIDLATGAEPKVIQTHKAKDVAVTLLSESGQLSKGKNMFVLQFTSAATNQPLDVGQVTLNTSMSMPGMAPMVADATLAAEKTPGRYLGTIDFPDTGTRQVTVTWDGPAGKGSTRFSVPVR